MVSTVWKKSTCRLYFSKRHKGIKLGNFNRQKTYFRTKGISTKSENPITNVYYNTVGACSSNSLATRRGTRNLIYILLLFFSLFSTFTLLLLFTLTSNYFKYSSGFNSQSWTCLGQLTGRFSIVYLIANIVTGLLLLGNRLAFAQSQLISTKERRSALTPQTRPPVTFLIWQ